MSEDADDDDEEEFCCLRRQLKEDVDVDRFGPPPRGWGLGLRGRCGASVGDDAANLLPLPGFFADLPENMAVVTRLWTTPPDGDSSTL